MRGNPCAFVPGGKRIGHVHIECIQNFAFDFVKLSPSAPDAGPGPGPDPALSPGLLQARAEAAAGLLKMLANPDRLLLLCLLSEGPATVGELAQRSGVGQPRLSQQLMLLRAQGLVQAGREGRHVRYQLASPAAAAVLQTLHQVYCPQPAPEQDH